MRIAFAHCRLHHRQVVSVSDALMAIALTEQSHAVRNFSVHSAEQLITARTLSDDQLGKSLHDFTMARLRPTLDGQLSVEAVTDVWDRQSGVKGLREWVRLTNLMFTEVGHHADQLWEAKQHGKGGGRGGGQDVEMNKGNKREDDSRE
jgi:hypothetical protein